ncbi:hypothetical protein HMPREF9396_1688 [Streptococcus sanguinis SK1059]|nr:hypothetical protein HMPREF9396_1688 [Streptococcus sanguinis SK1059]
MAGLSQVNLKRDYTLDNTKKLEKGKNMKKTTITTTILLSTLILNSVAYADELANNIPIITQPTTPAQPTEPVTPTQPTTPAQPTEPVTPTQPTTPAQPTEPVAPTQPTTPAQPTEPVTPTQPTTPAQPTEPVAPTQPTTPAQPTEPVAPTQPTTPAQPTEPVAPTQPTTPAQPTEPSTPIQLTRPAVPDTSLGEKEQVTLRRSDRISEKNNSSISPSQKVFGGTRETPSQSTTPDVRKTESVTAQTLDRLPETGTISNPLFAIWGLILGIFSVWLKNRKVSK